MQINWCLKGIAENASFSDAQAAAVLSSTGILSNWILANATLANQQANINSQNVLNASALEVDVWVILRRLIPNALELAAANAHDRDPDFIMKLRITLHLQRAGYAPER